MSWWFCNLKHFDQLIINMEQHTSQSLNIVRCKNQRRGGAGVTRTIEVNSAVWSRFGNKLNKMCIIFGTFYFSRISIVWLSDIWCHWKRRHSSLERTRNNCLETSRRLFNSRRCFYRVWRKPLNWNQNSRCCPSLSCLRWVLKKLLNGCFIRGRLFVILPY